MASPLGGSIINHNSNIVELGDYGQMMLLSGLWSNDVIGWLFDCLLFRMATLVIVD